MNQQKHSSPGDQPDDWTSQFFTTDWSAIARAGEESSTGDRPQLSSVLVRYTRALKAHLYRRWRLNQEEADDVLQSFVAEKILQRDLIAKANRGRGKFRTFLLTALDRYVISQHRKRSRSVAGQSFSEEQPDTNEAPDDVFVREWAQEVITEAIRRLQAECAAKERPDIWDVFDCQILQPTLQGAKPLAYEEFVGRFGFQSAVQASNVCVTAKRMYERTLCGVVAEYCETNEIEAELDDLIGILSKSRA